MINMNDTDTISDIGNSLAFKEWFCYYVGYANLSMTLYYKSITLFNSLKYPAQFWHIIHFMFNQHYNHLIYNIEEDISKIIMMINKIYKLYEDKYNNDYKEIMDLKVNTLVIEIGKCIILNDYCQ